MLKNHIPVGDAFGSCCTDIVLPDNLQHGGTGYTGHSGHAVETQRKSRQNDALQSIHLSADRKPLQIDGENKNQNQAKPECGAGNTDDCNKHREAVKKCVLFDSSNNTERQSKNH